MPHSGVQLKLDRSGGVTVFCGATEIGQGSDDVLVACVAEVLGIEPIDIRAVTGDTDLTPVDLGSYSSRVTLMMGNAAIQAAERARELLADAVSKKLDGPDGSARLRRAPRLRRREPGHAASPSPRRCCSPRRRSARSARPARYTPPRSPAQFKGGGVGPSPAYSYSAAVVEVEVDPATGWIHVPRVWIAHDIGRALNPTLVRGQVEGSVYMGARRGADGGAGVPPAAAEAVARARAQVPVDARVQEPDDARHAGGVHRAGRGSRSARARSAPRKSARGRCCRSCRRSPTPSTTRSACASTRCRSRRRRSCKALDAKAAGQAGALRSDALSRRSPWPEPLDVPPPWEGGDGKASNSPSARAKADAASKQRRCAMMRLPQFEYHAPRTVARGGGAARRAPGDAMLVAGGTDLLPNMKRRQQVPPTLIGLRARRASCATIAATANGPRRSAPALTLDRARARRAHPRRAIRRCASGRAGRDAAPAQHGHARRQPLPRHALQLLRPELRVAQGDRLLHEEGRRRSAGSRPASPRCLAVSSTDTAPALLALGATVTLVSRCAASARLPRRRPLSATTASTT